MTAKEAMKIRKGDFPDSGWKDGTYEELSKCIDEALEKQVPKPIEKHSGDHYGTPYSCPVCGADIIKVEFMRPDGSECTPVSYCWACGKALDWSEV